VLLLPRAAALLVWLRLWPDTLTSSESTAHLLAGVLAGITFVVPLLQARVAHDLVRQWTLLAVAQGGWLLLAIAAWSFGRKPVAPSESWPVVEWNLPNAAQAAWLLLLLDGVAVIGLFGVLAYLRRRDRPAKYLADLQGLWHFEPLAAGCAGICLLSLTGVPLLAGFWSRLVVALAAMNVRGEWGPPQMPVPHIGLLVLTVVAALSAVWSGSVAGRSLWTMFFGLPLGQPRPAGAISSLFVAVLASLLLLGCGLLPGPLLSWLCAPVE
jgi:NADH-quinone oxidoreductase subunit N